MLRAYRKGWPPLFREGNFTGHLSSFDTHLPLRSPRGPDCGTCRLRPVWRCCRTWFGWSGRPRCWPTEGGAKPFTMGSAARPHQQAAAPQPSRTNHRRRSPVERRTLYPDVQKRVSCLTTPSQSTSGAFNGLLKSLAWLRMLHHGHAQFSRLAVEV